MIAAVSLSKGLLFILKWGVEYGLPNAKAIVLDIPFDTPTTVNFSEFQ